MNLKLIRIKIAPLVYIMQKILFRMTLFSFLLLFASSLLFIAGNMQRFLDSNQALVLRQMIFMSITLFFFSLVSIFFTVLDTLLSKFFAWKKLAVIVFYVVCVILSVVCGVMARGVMILSLGYST